MSGLATMRAMIELGLTDDQKLILLAAIEEDRGPARSASAERQRRYRQRRKEASVTSDVTPLHNERDVTPPPIEDTSYPLSSETKVSSEVDKPAREPNPFPKPEWADPQHWRDFMANRKRRRMTNSPTAYKQFLGDVDRLADDEWPPGRLLELAAGKGWGSINKPEQDQRNGRTNGMGRDQSGSGLGPSARAALDVFGPLESEARQ